MTYFLTVLMWKDCHFPSQEKGRSNVKSLQNLFHYITITRKKFQAKYTTQLPREHKNEEACISSHGLGVLFGKFGTTCTWALKKWIQWPHVFRMVLFSFPVLFPLWCWKDIIYVAWVRWVEVEVESTLLSNRMFKLFSISFHSGNRRNRKSEFLNTIIHQLGWDPYLCLSHHKISHRNFPMLIIRLPTI